MAQPPRYRQIDHTADFALQVWGETRPALYANAAEGVCALLFDLDAVQPREQRTVTAQGYDGEEVLVDWLGQLLFLAEAEGFLACRFEIAQLGETHLRATVSGEPFDPGRHRWHIGIKAVTYHDLQIRSAEGGGWTVTMVLDT